ncbi:hypothetical protein KIN20_022437 [Parelaphostrongylus tenuis]|uniref:Uncharacterized protein n=1 Tax=Parelaphostrongylus tenuis TaxID=148309 RepID=A0AAD5MQC3_PARTN|nr:hypothetical protein KIN20_022437 [Parelaphostrongylus tenuis]
MEGRPTEFLVILLLAIISAVFGCGVMPGGQRIATSKGGAQAFVSRLVMQTVFDVLEGQGRSALLPAFVISSILNQLEVRITYEPLLCQRVVFDITKAIDPQAMVNDQYCIITSNTVTGICTALMAAGGKKCAMMGDATITPIPANHMSISGTLSTTNIVMATWSKMMWQSVVDRAVRTLASGPFGTPFFSARVTVGGN